MAEVTAYEERMARLTAPATNGGSPALPDPDDLDWFLFRSFPGCEVPGDRFVALLPVFERALRAGVRFDAELLFVRVLELGGAVSDDARRSLASAAGERVFDERFDPADTMAAIRFAIRALPAAPDVLGRLVNDPALELLRWQLTLDFALDERCLDDYLAVSYLRDGDPDVVERLAHFPVPPESRTLLASMFGEDEGRWRIEAGFEEFVESGERGMLLAALADRFPGFTPAVR